MRTQNPIVSEIEIFRQLSLAPRSPPIGSGAKFFIRVKSVVKHAAAASSDVAMTNKALGTSHVPSKTKPFMSDTTLAIQRNPRLWNLIAWRMPHPVGNLFTALGLGLHSTWIVFRRLAPPEGNNGYDHLAGKHKSYASRILRQSIG
jgi:hypothetical protein